MIRHQRTAPSTDGDGALTAQIRASRPARREMRAWYERLADSRPRGVLAHQRLDDGQRGFEVHYEPQPRDAVFARALADQLAGATIRRRRSPAGSSWPASSLASPPSWPPAGSATRSSLPRPFGSSPAPRDLGGSSRCRPGVCRWPTGRGPSPAPGCGAPQRRSLPGGAPRPRAPARRRAAPRTRGPALSRHSARPRTIRATAPGPRRGPAAAERRDTQGPAPLARGGRRNARATDTRLPGSVRDGPADLVLGPGATDCADREARDRAARPLLGI